MNQDQEDASIPTILVVEDDESTGETITTIISQETPYRALLVTNGMDALKVVRQHKLHLFILDYRLPDITGIQLFDQLQAIQELKNIPTLLMSASKPKEEIEPRNVTILDKPFDLDELIYTINKLISY